jgi:indole-3-glycerol phosphate synthase
MTILDEIFSHKRVEVVERRQARPLAEVRRAAEAAAPPEDFVAALRRSSAGWPALIAEVKRASPSRGRLVERFDPLELARAYRDNGAAAISVLTDERYFQGRLDDLRQVAGLSPRRPVLRKDFLFDPYQVYEARAHGADAVLLIAAYLDPGCLRELHNLAGELGMRALVEVHDRAELDAALACGPALVGINNRDLRDFRVRLETSLELRALVPPVICLVAESGIHTRADVARLAGAGIDAVLVGEALVVARDVAAKVRELAGFAGQSDEMGEET